MSSQAPLCHSPPRQGRRGKGHAEGFEDCGPTEGAALVPPPLNRSCVGA